MDTQTSLAGAVATATTPTAGRVAAIGASNLITTLAKAAAGAAALHGWIGASNVEMVTSAIVLVLTFGYSFWKDYGRDIAVAVATILRAKIMDAAAKAQRNPAAAPAAIAVLAAHVEATAPAGAPTGSPGAPVAILVIGLSGLAAGWWPGPAAAQAQFPQPRPQATSGPNVPRPPICDPAQLLPGCHVELQEGGKQTTKPVELDLWKKISDAALPDLDYASALAAAAGTNASMVRKQCWDALILANKQANGSGVKNADGTARPKPDPSLFTDVESLAEVLDNLAPGGPLWVACAGAAQLAKTNVLTLLNAMVTGASGLAALGVT